jgi:hypothetical protein
VQEFRPADVIDQDTRLAETLIDGEFEALGTLVERYGRAVGAVVAASPVHDTQPSDRSVGVFAQAWLERSNVDPGSDFTPWLGGLAAAVTDRPASEVEDTWAVAMAIEAVDAAVRPVLRAHHVGGAELPEDVDRHERRLRSRLAHLGDDDVVVTALGDPRPWSDPDVDLAQQVGARLGFDNTSHEAQAGQASGTDVVSEDAAVPNSASRVTRSLRPVFLGLAAALAVLFVAIVALSAASGSPDPIAFTADLTPTGAILDVEGGELTVTERDTGLRLDLEAPTLPRRAGDQFYEGVLVLQDGTELTVGTFNQGFGVILSAGVALDRVEEFLVVARNLGTDDADVILKLDVPRS